MKSNQEIVKILKNTAILYEMDDIPFRPRAYERAAAAIESLDKEVSEILKTGGEKALEEIQGVGPSIAKHLESILKKGTFSEYERIRKRIPVNLEELTSIPTLGPKTIKTLWQKLKIKNLNDLEAALRAGKLRNIPHFGKKSEEKILHNINFHKKTIGRHTLGEVMPLVELFESRLKRISGVEHVTTAGSVRRRQETIGDIDILVTAKNAKRVMDFFISMPEVKEVTGRGKTKTSVILKNNIQADVRVLPDNIYGAALQYFTGSKDHNIEVRKIAIKKGLKLSEYGLFKGKKLIAGRTEEEIYKALGMECMPPEIRTASGEIEAAQNNKLPKLIQYGSIRGDLQVQTDWTDGDSTIMEMVEAGRKAGLEYIAITDHTKALAMTGGLDEKKLAAQGREIDRLNKKLRGFRILKSSEVNILKDGSLDMDDKVLRTLDLVSVAVHSHFNMTEKEMTERIIKAIKHPLVNILFHPTGRLINRREPYKLDMIKILHAAKEYGVAMEVNAFLDRLDLRDAHIREAIKLGVKLVVDSDAHAPHHFDYLDFGVAQVRRGWGTSKDILNTKPVDEFLKTIKELKKK